MVRNRSSAGLLLVMAIVGACGTPAATSTPAPVTPTAAPTVAPTAAPPTQASTGSIRDVVTAAEASIAKKTAGIVQTIQFNGNATVPDGTKGTLTGVTAFTQPMQLAATADFAALGVGAFDMIVNDQLIYMKGTLVEPLAGAGKWLLVDLTSDDPRAASFKSLATGQNDASLLLYFLYGGQDPVMVRPDATLDGQPMRHFSMAVDIDAAATTAPAEARERLAANAAALKAGGMDTTVQAEVWIGADGLVHRVDYTYTVGAAIGGGTLLVSCLFSKYGEPLDLGIPAEADVVNLEDV
jgi:hypothetical protein